MADFLSSPAQIGVYGGKNPHYTKGIRPIHIWNFMYGPNKQERLNGGFADSFRYTRGINKEESLIFRIVIIHYNYIKPHGGIAYKTPAEAAGIDMYGTDKSIVQSVIINRSYKLEKFELLAIFFDIST